ncbi:MAG: ABC transporter ATP-binding protein [Candidatus Woesearchaeota archaeon]
MLKVSHLKKSYGDFTAVRNSSFEVNDGEIVAIIGPNGAGKTTTLKMICSLLKPDKGEITFDDLDYEKDIDKIKRQIGYVPEESAIYEGMNPMEYLMFFADLYDIPKDKAKKKIDNLLDSLNLPEKDRPLGNMSKGMKRKVLIARSLLNDPKLLIYDEPASGLDPHTANFILNYVLDLKKLEKTILFTAHNLHQVEFVCDRIIILNKGRIIMNDKLENVKKVFGGPIYKVKYRQNKTLRTKEFDTISKLNRFISKIFKEKKSIIDLKVEEKSLEDIFLKMTAGKKD